MASVAVLPKDKPIDSSLCLHAWTLWLFSTRIVLVLTCSRIEQLSAQKMSLLAGHQLINK